MLKSAYANTKREFFNDVITNKFFEKVSRTAAKIGIGGGVSEATSWENNSLKVKNLLEAAEVPDDTYVVFELKFNGGRADCVLLGKDANNVPHIEVLELKQWSNENVETARVAAGNYNVHALVARNQWRFTAHPSQQADHYVKHMLHYNAYALQEEKGLNGLAYCYNYSSKGDPCALYDKLYKPVIDRCALFSGDQIADLAARLKGFFAGGQGKEVFDALDECPEIPTPRLADKVKDVFENPEADFILLDDQLTSRNAILDMAEEVLQNPSPTRKKVLIVKGGPGTGKTVIALTVLAELAKRYPTLKAFYTTRSKALRNTLRAKLGDAKEVIRNIYDFRPSAFPENGVDILLVDEAHRITHSDNHQTREKREWTYLTMMHALLYCSKVCVLFIDDRQGVKREEIGTSQRIYDVASRYAEEMTALCKQNEDERAFWQGRLDVARRRLAELQNQMAAGADNRSCAREFQECKARVQVCEKELNRRVFAAADVAWKTQAIDINVIELQSQFRCGGSDNYLDWVDKVIYEEASVLAAANPKFGKEYLFEVCDSPAELERRIRALNAPADHPAQIARLAAGYCWTWSNTLQPNGDLYHDVKIGDWEMPWETNGMQARGVFADKYAPSADLWVSDPQGINQVGCIFSAQGFEVDYIGVILGPDIKFDPARGKIVAVPGHTHNLGVNDIDTYVRNIYRVLMTRGTKGCLIYCCDPALGEYLKTAAARAQEA